MHTGISVIIFFSVLLTVSPSGYAQPAKPQPAATVPEFTFYTLNDNKPFTRNHLPVNGRTVFVFFDPDCGHCQDEISDIGTYFAQFRQASFFLVAMQDKPIIYNFLGKYGTMLQGKRNVTVLHDANYEFIRKFTPSQYPSLFIYGPDRQLIRYLDGPKKIKTIIEAVNN